MYLLRTDTVRKVITHGEGGGIVNYSLLTQLETAIPFRGFSIKYVGHGAEDYVLNGRKYKVLDHEFILANRHCDGRILLDTKEPVQGLCIDLNQDYLMQAIESFRESSTIQVSDNFLTYFDSEAYFENKYHHSSGVLGQALFQLNRQLHRSPYQDWDFDTDFFRNLAFTVVANESERVREFSNIRTHNLSVKKDVFRRLCGARLFMDEHFREKLTIQALAEVSCMSEFHFHRMFRQAFGISPYQYLIAKRLDFAKHFMSVDGATVTETATFAGFTDVHAFCKTYKKRFGVSPGSTLRNRA